MKLTTQTVELRLLTASEGMVLTNGRAFTSVGGGVYLSKDSNIEDWREITEEEAIKLQEEVE